MYDNTGRICQRLEQIRIAKNIANHLHYTSHCNFQNALIYVKNEWYPYTHERLAAMVVHVYLDPTALDHNP